MSFLRAAILLAALSAPVAASATTFDDVAARTSGASVAGTLAESLISRRPLLVEDVGGQAAQNYFDYDALLTLGALALTIGLFAAFARRPREEVGARPEIDGAARWMQNDLARRFARARDAA